MKSTELYNIHKESGATFSEFGGYNMPLWFKSSVNEHINVIKNVGLFDTSNMSVLKIKGRETTSLINSSFSRKVSGLKIGRLIYGLFLNKSGFVIDDGIIYRLDITEYMIVINAGMAEIIIDYLKSFNFNNYTISDYTDIVVKLDIQGPKSLQVLEKLYGSDLFDSFPYFSFKGDFEHQGILISRSGYTGEFGFELYIHKSQAQSLWKILLKEGAEYNIIPCGLAARDSLRVGAGLPLSHQDIGNWEFCNNPWSFSVDHPIESKSSYTYAYVGYDVRKLHNGHGDVFSLDKKIGEVLSCITEVSITRYKNKIYSISSPNLPADHLVKGLVAGFIKVDVELDIGCPLSISDQKRSLKVEVVDNIRPNRTAKKSIEEIRSIYE